MTDPVTVKIMFKIADREEHRLRFLFLILTPLIGVFSGIFVYCLFSGVYYISNQGFFSLVLDYHLREEFLIYHLQEILIAFWQESHKVFLAGFLVSLLILLFIFIKTDLKSHPFRFRQIKKYLSETS